MEKEQNAICIKIFDKMLAYIVTTFTIMLNVSVLSYILQTVVNRIKVKYKK